LVVQVNDKEKKSDMDSEKKKQSGKEKEDDKEKKDHDKSALVVHAQMMVANIMVIARADEKEISAVQKMRAICGLSVGYTDEVYATIAGTPAVWSSALPATASEADVMAEKARAADFRAKSIADALEADRSEAGVMAQIDALAVPKRMPRPAPAIKEMSYKRVRAAGKHKEATSSSPPPWRKKL
jgi:predicted DNA repair protein MutK